MLLGNPLDSMGNTIPHIQMSVWVKLHVYYKNNNTTPVQPLIIAVEENETVLNDTPDKLGMEAVCIDHLPFSSSYKLIRHHFM